jgi:hypothetical protein
MFVELKGQGGGLYSSELRKSVICFFLLLQKGQVPALNVSSVCCCILSVAWC